MPRDLLGYTPPEANQEAVQGPVRRSVLERTPNAVLISIASLPLITLAIIANPYLLLAVVPAIVGAVIISK